MELRFRRGPRLPRAPPDVRETAIVRDAEDEGTRRARCAKSGQRLPDGEEDILREVVALRARRRVDGDHPPERGPVLPQDFIERHARYSLARAADLTRFAERLSAVWVSNLCVATLERLFAT